MIVSRTKPDRSARSSHSTGASTAGSGSFVGGAGAGSSAASSFWLAGFSFGEGAAGADASDATSTVGASSLTTSVSRRSGLPTAADAGRRTGGPSAPDSRRARLAARAASSEASSMRTSLKSISSQPSVSSSSAASLATASQSAESAAVDSTLSSSSFVTVGGCAAATSRQRLARRLVAGLATVTRLGGFHEPERKPDVQSLGGGRRAQGLRPGALLAPPGLSGAGGRNGLR